MPATNTKDDVKPEEIAPLLDEKVDPDAEVPVVAAPTGPEVEVVDIDSESGCAARAVRKALDFLGHRSTYYMIALIAQFCHLTVSAIGYGFSIVDAGNKNASNRNMYIVYIVSMLISWYPFVIILSLIRVQHSKKKAAQKNKRITAGHHYICARVCAFFDMLNTIYLVLPVVTSDHPLEFSDPVRPIITPLAIGFVFVAGVACMIAARIIRLSATNARGTALVQDPDYRVPAWKLATVEESQSCRRADREVQLSDA